MRAVHAADLPSFGVTRVLWKIPAKPHGILELAQAMPPGDRFTHRNGDGFPSVGIPVTAVEWPPRVLGCFRVLMAPSAIYLGMVPSLHERLSQESPPVEGRCQWKHLDQAGNKKTPQALPAAGFADHLGLFRTYSWWNWEESNVRLLVSRVTQPLVESN